MFRTIKSIALFAVLSLLFFMNSCLSDPISEDARTPEMEALELHNALIKFELEGFNIDTSELGIYYIIHEEGTGPFAQAGDTLGLEYAGYLLNGYLFDASANHYDDDIWHFNYKENALIPGFDFGISLMQEGTELDMIIPSELAYGSYGQGVIPPYSSLIFSAKMHSLKPKVE
jgi:FKBP-type peptidyl-prolyl cis-trans isomerase FkpA